MSRKIDYLGRLVLPSEIRKAFGIREGDHLDIAIEDERIILTLSHDRCVFCRSSDDLLEVKGRKVCGTCMKELSQSTSEKQDWDPFA